MGENKEKELQKQPSASEEKSETPQADAKTAHHVEVGTSNSIDEPSTSEEKKEVPKDFDSNKDVQPKDKELLKTSEGPSESKEKSENNNVEDSDVVAHKTSQTTISQTKTSEEEEDEVLDDENAEDAEDADNERRHAIPLLDYEAMTMENLVGELQKLVRNEKVQSIKKHVDGIKYEFDQKFDDFLESKKEKFIESGGNEIDFRYNSTTKTQFN